MSLDIHDNACSSDFTFPLPKEAPMQPSNFDPALDLYTRCALCLVAGDIVEYEVCQHFYASPVPGNLV